MCGGVGTRLRPLTFERPKPNIPLLNKPSIGHLVEQLSAKGFDDIVITLGYLGEKIEEYLGDGSIFGVSIKYVYEKERLGTAGSVRNAKKHLEDAPFLIVGGDHVLDLNLREFYHFHKQHGGVITIGLLPIDDPKEYGIASIDVGNRVTRFREKPPSGQIFSNLASTGIYVCDSEVFDWIPAVGRYDFAKDLFPALLQANEPVYGWLARGPWTDLGNPRDYRAASKWMLENLQGTEIAGDLHLEKARLMGPMVLKHNVSLGQNSAIIGPVVIGENTKIGANVLIGPYTTIGDNCEIQDNSQVLSSYIYNDVKVGSSTSVCGAIIDNDTVIGNKCTLENGTVIGPRAKVQDKVTIHSDVLLWPEVVIESGAEILKDVLNKAFETSTTGS